MGRNLTYPLVLISGATSCQGLPPVDNGVCEVPTNPIPDFTLNGANNGSAFPGQAGTWRPLPVAMLR